MKLDLNDKYRVVTDKHNYILQEKRIPNVDHHKTNQDSKPRYVDLGYFNNFKHIARYLIEREIKTGNTQCLLTLNDKIERLSSEIAENIERGVKNEFERISNSSKTDNP